MIYYLFEILGTLVFAIAGAQRGVEKKMDIFGCAVLAFATAIGGGTLRDVMLGITPVSWTRDIYTILTIFCGVLLAFFLEKSRLQHQKTTLKLLFLFDTIGISLFTILGIEKAYSVEVSGLVALMMGISTAVFGGVVRDLLAGEIPLVLRKEVYATACLAGGVVYLALKQTEISRDVQILITSLTIFCIRFFAVKYNWKLPSF